jgi:hypothetical protein
MAELASPAADAARSPASWIAELASPAADAARSPALWTAELTCADRAPSAGSSASSSFFGLFACTSIFLQSCG